MPGMMQLRSRYEGRRKGISDLAGAGDQQHRELPGGFLEPVFESAGELHGRPPIVCIAQQLLYKTVDGYFVNGFRGIGEVKGSH